MIKALIQALALSVCVSMRAAELFDYTPFLKSLRVSEDFAIELVAGEPQIHFPMFACFDDKGRLYVAESSGSDLYAGLKILSRDCRVSRLEDLDGDGHFERATVFADHITFPMGLVWREGRLFLADPPDLVALSDNDDDGRADRREVILSGFGHTDNGSLHGLAFGPDGLLYFTMGEPDGWKLPRGDGTFLEGTAGALFRCRPDGSGLEVISRGFENLVEVEFMPGGEIVGTDNWYQRPAGGYRDALIDLSPGGLYPYALNRGTPLPRTGITLPPLTLRPAVAHSGLTRPRGTGLPPAWRNSLFVAEHNTRKVVRHELKREGATFSATQHDFIVGEHPDFHPSDVLEDSDGSLLIVDTGGWYVEHCPTGRIRDSRAPGGIYRVRWKNVPKIADPIGRNLKWNEASAAELIERFGDFRPAVANRAEQELVLRVEIRSLASILRSRTDIDTRVRALWALARLPSSNVLPILRDQLTATDEVVVCAAARAVALRGDKMAAERLTVLLEWRTAPVRRAAAEALVMCGSSASAPYLVAALSKALDDFEEHACGVALLALAQEPFVRSSLDHPETRVRRTSLFLLDQPPFTTLQFTDLAAPLGSENLSLRSAARALLEGHPEWANAALPWFKEQLASGQESVALENLLVSFQSNRAIRNLITELIAAGPTTARSFVLKALPSLTAKPPEDAWLRGIAAALTNATLRAAGLTAASAFPRPEFQPLLTGVCEDPTASAAERFLAARLSARELHLGEPLFALALDCLDPKATAPDRLAAADLLARARLSSAQLLRLLQKLGPRGPVSPDALLPAIIRAAADETRAALDEFFKARLQAGWSPDRTTLDNALAILTPSMRAPLLAVWELNSAGRLRRLKEFEPLAAGGDPDRGREYFNTATCAGCHRIGNLGGLIGPDLSKIGAIRSGVDLLESILYPSSSFAQGFEPYILVRRDGEELAGNLLAQGPDEVTLRDTTGTVHRIRTDDIASLDRQQLSMMPEGLEQLLTREQFRDLLAYLQNLK